MFKAVSLMRWTKKRGAGHDRAEVCSARPGPPPAAPHPNPLPREREEYLRGERGGISFVVCVSDDVILKANLLASPGLVGPSSPHEVILIHKAPSAGAGLNLGLERAQHEWVVCVHQDVLLPEGWDRCLTEQLREAEQRFGPIGVAGVYGVGAAVRTPSKGFTLGAQRVGWVVDRGRTLHERPELPARVATLDELLLVVRRDTPLRFDPALGFHMYGADICLQAAERGLAVVALGASATTTRGASDCPRRFSPAPRSFARKWAHRLPVATSCVIIDRDGKVCLLGNTPFRRRSISHATQRGGKIR